MLGDRHLMITHETTDTPLTLSIIDLDTLKAKQDRGLFVPSPELDAYQVCQLEFPAKRLIIVADDMFSEWCPSRLWHEYPVPVPCTPGRNYLVALTARYPVSPAHLDGFEECTLLAPLSTFMACISQSAQQETRKIGRAHV